MRYGKYSVFVSGGEHSSFDFTSTGPKGKVKKRVMFLPMNRPEIFSLTFGDLRTDGRLDDRIITGNGDRDKILATIADIVMVYTKIYPERWIFFEGSTVARTRLYKMAIALNRKELSKKFDIYGVIAPGTVLPFTIEGTFDAFLIKRK